MTDIIARPRLCAASAVAVFIAVFIAALAIGRYPVSLGDVSDFLMGDLPRSSNEFKVIHDLRLPRTIVAALVGIGLSLSGLLYQETFRNKLVSPDFLGVTSGASVGAALAILLGLSSFAVSLSAFAAGIVTVLATISLARSFRNRSPTVLLLSGIIMGGLMGSVLSFIKYLADPESTLASITFWLMGSCENVSLEDVTVLFPIVSVCTVLFLLIRWRINLVALGRDEAQTRGLDYRLYRALIIIGATLMTAGSVSVVGSIGWIGLVVPHMARLLVGRNTAYSVPLTVALGAVLMVLVDVLSRSFTDSEIPLSAITGLFGTVILIAIILMRRRCILDSDTARGCGLRISRRCPHGPGWDRRRVRTRFRQCCHGAQRLWQDHAHQDDGRSSFADARCRILFRQGYQGHGVRRAL